MDKENHFYLKNPRIAGSLLSIALSAGKMGTWTFDVKAGLFQFTEEFYNVFKTSTNEIGSSFMTVDDYAQTFIPSDYQSIVQQEVQKALLSTTENYSKALKHPVKFYDGSNGVIKVSFQIIRNDDGEIVYLTGVNQDITEEELQFKKLIDKKNELQQANSSIKTLIGHMSHDLRNPIANIKAMSEILTDVECQNELHTLIHTESDRALKLISNILSESVVTTGKVELHKGQANVSTLLQNSVDRISRIYKRHLSLSEDKVTKQYIAHIDSHRIEQVFDNLLSNAVKYSPDKSPIKIQLTEHGVFRIANHILNDKKVHKEHSRSAVYSSTGFGLEIIHSLLKGHGFDFKRSIQDDVYAFEFKFQ